MKSTINKQIKTLKKSIEDVSRNSKENIKSVIESNTKQFDSAVDTNKKAFDSISKMLYEKEMDPSIVSVFKSTFGKSIKMSEDVIDSIIDSYIQRMDLSIDFTSRFMEIVKNENLNTKEGIDKLVELVKESFDKSSGLSMSNMEKVVLVYNDHLHLALNFNKKFADNINSQITSMFKLQKKNMDSFFALDMVAEWWKNVGEEKAKV